MNKSLPSLIAWYLLTNKTMEYIILFTTMISILIILVIGFTIFK